MVAVETAFAQPQGQLDLAVFPVQLFEGYEGTAPLGDLLFQLKDFRLWSSRRRVARLVLEKSSAVSHGWISQPYRSIWPFSTLANASAMFTFPARMIDFRAFEFQSVSAGIQDFVVPAGFFIGGDVCACVRRG